MTAGPTHLCCTDPLPPVTPRDLLRAARVLLTFPCQWIRGELAARASSGRAPRPPAGNGAEPTAGRGEPCESWRPEAMAFGLWGALRRAGFDLLGPFGFQYDSSFSEACRVLGRILTSRALERVNGLPYELDHGAHYVIHRANEHPETTFEDVCGWLDEAISYAPDVRDESTEPMLLRTEIDDDDLRDMMPVRRVRKAAA